MMEKSEENKNEYFLKKEQKEREAEVHHHKKKIKLLLRIIGLSLVILTLAYLFFKWSGNTNTPVPGEFFEAQSRNHIAAGQEHTAYNSNPPTGGWHYGQPAQTGIYDKELPDEQIIHNLEHGHIWFTYSPDLPQDQIEALADIAKDFGSRIIMTPRSANDSPIAIVAWEHIFKTSLVDREQIRVFVKAYRNVAGPERNIPDHGFGDFRTK